jgi:hypothetical protein
MKKTLLIAAAALAAGVISTQAQVYSQNVVGYVNQPVPANSYQIIASDMMNGSDSNATNGDVNTTLVNGFISSPVPVTGGNPGQNPALSTNSQLIVWNGSTFATYYFFNASDAVTWNGAGSLQGWYDTVGDYLSYDMGIGLSAFVFNHSGSPMTVTTVGTVEQGTNVENINPGYNLICLQEPISTNPITPGYGLPTTMTSSNDIASFQNEPTTQTQDSILTWNGSVYTTYFYFNAADATAWENSYGAGPAFSAGFYDTVGGAMPSSAYPQVNQGFFIHHIGAAISWTNSFTVQ